VAKVAAQYDVLANRHVVDAVHGVALARLGRAHEAVGAFERAVREAEHLLKYSPGLYNARYARALALAGLALLRGDDLAPVLEAYGWAKALCSTEGVLQAQGRLLALLDAEEQLAPVRQLLEASDS
jgi:tetratricopeptide (TPR) repeat protein